MPDNNDLLSQWVLKICGKKENIDKGIMKNSVKLMTGKPFISIDRC